MHVAGWVKFAVMDSKVNGAVIHCYKAFSPDIHLVNTKTDEEIGVFHAPSLFASEFKTIPNLQYLIPLALDGMLSVTEPVIITYGHVN